MAATERGLTGLSEEEAQRALAQWGANELPSPGRRGLAKIAVETLREPMFLLLLAAAGLCLFLASLGEGVFLLLGACAAIALVVVQEARSERAREGP